MSSPAPWPHTAVRALFSGKTLLLLSGASSGMFRHAAQARHCAPSTPALARRRESDGDRFAPSLLVMVAAIRGGVIHEGELPTVG